MQPIKKNGFGVTAMVIYICILLAFLLIASINIYVYYNQKESEHRSVPSENTGSEESVNEAQQIYTDYEKEMKSRTITYIYTYYEKDLNNKKIRVPLSKLIESDLLQILKDPVDQKVCTGYTIISVENKKIISNPYLKCSNYVSKGYEENETNEND